MACVQIVTRPDEANEQVKEELLAHAETRWHHGLARDDMKPSGRPARATALKKVMPLVTATSSTKRSTGWKGESGELDEGLKELFGKERRRGLPDKTQQWWTLLEEERLHQAWARERRERRRRR